VGLQPFSARKLLLHGYYPQECGECCVGFLNDFVVRVRRSGLEICSVEKYLVRGLEGR